MRIAGKRIVAACFVLVCLASAAAAQTAGAARPRDEDAARREVWHKLLAFEGEDVWSPEFGSRKEVAALVNQLVPDKERKEPGSFAYNLFRPRLFERVETPGGVRYVLLVSPGMVFLPGQQWHNVYLFDEAGHLRGSSDFSSGWRVLVNEVNVTERKGLGAPLLKMEVSGFLTEKLSAEYYALLGDRAVLVRLEDASDRPVRNAYACPYPRVGPPAAVRSAEEWARALASADPLVRLEALMWVGGHHETLEDLKYEQEEERRWSELYPEDKSASGATLDRCPGAADDTVLYEDVRAREDVKVWLKELSKSEDEWVRQAAELALTPLKRYE